MLPAALVAMTLAAACGSNGQAAKTPSSSAGSPAASETIDTFMFSPKVLRVHVGQTVTWTNHDAIGHTVTSGTRDYEPGNGGHVVATHKDGMFDTQLDGRGATATFTTTKAGTFHYFCDRHPGMEADLEVS